MEPEPRTIVIGAGPAGLTAARELQNCDIQPFVVERLPMVGGIARTEYYKGFRFDIGGHRFYTKVPVVDLMWRAVLGDAFKPRPRLSRIYFEQRFYPYPLNLIPTLRQMGIKESTLILLSYLSAHLFPYAEEETYEQWVSNRFGKRLFNTFFKSYTEKVWGIPCDQIRAEWAAQRIKGLSLRAAVQNALFGGNQDIKSLINEFNYPDHGPGMMWEAFRADIVRNRGEVQCRVSVTQLRRQGDRITGVRLLGQDQNGKKRPSEREIPVDHIISSISLKSLIEQIEPAPPEDVLTAARSLKYRAFILVGLIIKKADLFPDNWIYIHDPSVQVGRIQNFKNWSAAMVPDPACTSLGMEYFCNEGDALWTLADNDLIELAKKELAQLGLVSGELVTDGCVFRQPKAYPVYDTDYRKHLGIIRDYLEGIDNLQTIGRNGMHRYNNQDHSMLTGLLAARNLAGENHDLWEVNTDRSYYEEWAIIPNSRDIVDQPPTKSVFVSKY